MSGFIENPNLRCPKCGYCLNGLPRRSRCPECSYAFIADEPNIEEAIYRFTKTIPKHWRLWLTPTSDIEQRRPWRVALLIILSSAALSVAFLSALFLAAILAAFLPYPPARGDHILCSPFLEVGLWARRVNFSPQVALVCAAWFVVGQLLLSRLICSWYWRKARLLKAHPTIMLRLGVVASACAPAVLLVPMAVMVCWQYVNVRFPPNLWREVFGLRWLRVQQYPLHLDAAQILCLLVLIPIMGVIALRLYRRHRQCIESVSAALTGIYAASAPPREDPDLARQAREDAVQGAGDSHA